MLAHLGGVPVEETVLILAPLAALTGGIAAARLRGRFARRRPRASARRSHA